ncbi:MAG: MMPL family transporter, partial [Bacteroidota bacterium]
QYGRHYRRYDDLAFLHLNDFLLKVRRPWGITVALISIGLGMLLFMGFMGGTGRELNAMSALYPVLMIIVGTSDVIHIMSKYIDELRKGKSKRDAITVTIKEIGLATLLTSTTTAVGFATLATSKIGPIKDFGINSAIGVMIAYLTVIIFTTAVLSMFKTEQLIKLGRGQAFWENAMQKMYELTLRHPRRIALGITATFAICLYGISQITTNYRVESNLPMGAKISEDFMYFEDEFAGFRPLELAVFVQGDYTTDDYEVVQQMAKVEERMKANPNIKSINSITSVYKSINQMNKANRPEAYEMPKTRAQFVKYQKLSDRIPADAVNVLVSSDKKKARITSRVKDLGADSIKITGFELEQWIADNTDPDIVQFKLTGTGMILDKNSEYIRQNLIEGLGIAIIIVSLLMVLLFRNIKMILISLIPNLL